MWRVALSVIAILIDVSILISTGVALSQSWMRIDVVPNAQTPGLAAGSPGSVAVTVTLLALFGLNILAILFGARLRLPGSARQAVARIFE
jgi:hypothetical protein